MPMTGRLWHQDECCAVSNIGRPIAQNTVYVVDSFLSLQPLGVPGQLLIDARRFRTAT